MGGRAGVYFRRGGKYIRKIPLGGSEPSEWREAFDPGKNYEASGDVNHSTRRVTDYLQHRWDEFSHSDVTAADRSAMTKGVDTVRGKVEVFGYIRTTNAMAINKLLYDPANAGKTDEEIFTRKDSRGRLRDLETVRTMDRTIDSHATSVDGTYSRYTSADAIASTFGFSKEEIAAIAKAGRMTSSQLKELNRVFAGKVGSSRAYTSASANRSMNAFKRMYGFERRLYVPKGTKAYIPSHNAQESETIFGRGMRTHITGVTVEDGHIVIHEMFDGYKKK